MSQPEVLDQNSPMVLTFMTTEQFVLPMDPGFPRPRLART